VLPATPVRDGGYAAQRVESRHERKAALVTQPAPTDKRKTTSCSGVGANHPILQANSRPAIGPDGCDGSAFGVDGSLDLGYGHVPASWFEVASGVLI
jgi:hypothetical protein